MKADNIVVLQKGKVVQQGTHDQLMADTGGDYWNLSNAQQLFLNDDLKSGRKVGDPEKQIYLEDAIEVSSEDFEIVPRSQSSVEVPKPFLGNFMLFLWEQNYQWRWYAVMILGALGAGGMLAQLLLFSAYTNSTQSLYPYTHFSSPSSSPCSIFGDNFFETRPASGVSCYSFSLSE
jgi:hypothetical protein